ncbi:BF3164 family lipoprotein [uncultured Parabacteroides sp.]|uniref:BF3164 family lipoprotein n=1 Tax=uncultured Parabacteroides sp. TaxID=512312 RepID=UPI00258E7F99|nr:BF3164 family lipoprotein [uncultured Parabacteroides sp.]
MKIYFILLITLTLYSCNFAKNEQGYKESIQENIHKLNAHIVNSSLMMSIARDIHIYNNYLIIRTFSDNKFLYILNKNTGDIITSLVPQGNGPNECIEMSDQIQIDKKGDLSWFDYAKKKLFICNLDTLIKSSVNYANIDFNKYNGNIDLILRLRNKYLVSLGDIFSEYNEIKRYAIFDSTKMNSSFLGFPIINNSSRNLNETYLNYRTSQHIALAPNEDRFVVTEIYEGILEIFQLTDSIKLNSIHPLFEYKKNELHGFVDLCATDSYIYAIKIDSNMDGTDKNNKYNKIMVFDWEGKYIKTFETDYNLLTFDIDEKTNCIYAIGQNITLDSEIQIISFKI